MQIINYYPPIIKQIKIIQQIAKAEDIEFEKLNAEKDKIEQNMFVLTADEIGVERFEKILNIDNALTDIESRKLYILANLCKSRLNLTDIKQMINIYAEEMEFICDINNMEIVIKLMGTERDKLITINKIIDDFIPLNIYYALYAHEPIKNQLNYGTYGRLTQKLILQPKKQKQGKIINHYYFGSYPQISQKLIIMIKRQKRKKTMNKHYIGVNVRYVQKIIIYMEKENV